MIDQMGVVDIAKVFREKNISQAYAKELLACYMFRRSGSDPVIDGILRRLVTEAPSHQFAMDYHICKDVGLKVEEMTENLSDCCNELLRHVNKVAHYDIICKRARTRFLPFFQLFPYIVAPVIPDAMAAGATKEGLDDKPKGNGDEKQREEIIIGKRASG